MNRIHPKAVGARRLYIVGLLAIFVFMGFLLSTLASAQTVTAMVVNSNSDQDKKNDGQCTLREAIIAANSGKQSGGKPGECQPIADGSGSYTILIDESNIPTSSDPQLPKTLFRLTRTDNGSEDSSNTGDLDVAVPIRVLVNSTAPVVIEGGPGFTDRVFHVLPTGTLTIENVAIRGGVAKELGGGIFVDGGVLDVSNSTLLDNNAGVSGGAIYSTGTASLNYVTVINNSVGQPASNALGGVVNAGASTLTVNNSYFDNNTCAGTIAGSAAHNVARNAAGCNAGLAEDAAVALVPYQFPAGDLPAAYGLPGDSIAVDAAGAPGTLCPPADQLGLFSRPQGSACDIGAMEKEFTYFVVTNTLDDGSEGSLRWAINQANAATGLSGIRFAIDGSGDCDPATITLSSPLPDISEPVIIDGSLLADGSRCTEAHITLTADEGTSFSGLTILDTASGSTVRDLIISGFGGSGIVIGDIGAASSDNTIEGNTISNNGYSSTPVFTDGGAEANDGITIVLGTGNLLSNNNIFGNAGSSVDLGADGPTDNDVGDGDEGANFVQNYPELYAASLDGYVSGIFNSQSNQTYDLQFFSSASCLGSDALSLVNPTPIQVTTDGDGYAVFSLLVADTPPPAGQDVFPEGTGLRATATDADGNTSEFSNCVASSENNVVWNLSKVVNYGQEVQQYLNTVGEARWYKFSVKPGTQITVDLFNLPANYDVTVYKDIANTYAQLLADSAGAEFDLDRLGSETPNEVIASASFTPSAFTPSAFTPSAFTPSAFTPSAFTPSAFTPSAFTPSAFTYDVIAPSAFTPSAFTPSAFTPSAFTPSAFTPNDTLAGVVDPALYSGAQLSSLIAVSAFDNLANESVTFNTWTNTGDYYVRVRGRNGAFSAAQPFSLLVTNSLTSCEGVDFTNLDPTLTGPNAYYPVGGTAAPDTVILVDWNRLQQKFGGDPDVAGNDLYNLNEALKHLAGKPEVDGVIVEIGQPGSKIERLNQEAEEANNYACPYAKNVVAEEVKNVVDSFRSGGDLQYVVIIGNDEITPFFRVPDTALLGPENWYDPPVSIFTSSEASLRGNYILTDDYYGAEFAVSYKDSSIPAVDLATGRLVESPQDMLAQLAAYDQLDGGVVNANPVAGGAPLPLQSTVTGYDFLVDAVHAIRDELQAGTGVAPEELITAQDVAPFDTTPFAQGGPWTADDLLATLDNNDSDLIFLAGHFSASTALAADFQTGITTLDMLNLTGDWSNVIVYSAGCHSGYNVVDHHATPFTFSPDWASAFASRGSLLIGGTGYQYGDTDFLEYSERLYLYFTEQLRADTGSPVSVGQAMVAAKQQYMAETPVLRGIHQKALIEATVYGLPMLAVDMPNRATAPSAGPDVATAAVAGGPGQALGLRYADKSFDFTPHWNPADASNDPFHVVTLEAASGESLTASWLSGENGVLTNLGEPALPLFAENVSAAAVPDGDGVPYSLRGVGFRGGTYEDFNEIPGSALDIFPLIGAATTEIRAVHLNFLAPFWFPLRIWSANLFDNLFNGADGSSTLFMTPAQYRTSDLSQGTPPPSTLRRFNSADFRLYYSDYTTDALDGSNTPSLASPPNIAQVIGTPNGGMVDVEALVVGNPGAGIQTVWTTFTGESGDLYGSWTSVDLTQDLNDSRVWRGSFPVGNTPMEDVRFIVQACSGVGPCLLVDNVGFYFIPGEDGEKAATALTQPVSSGASFDVANNVWYQKVGDEVTFTATLTDQVTGLGLSSQPVFFGLGSESRLGITNGSGVASATFLLVSAPGEYEVTAWYPGNASSAAATSAPLPFRVDQQTTTLGLSGPAAAIPSGNPLGVTALLLDGSAPPPLPLSEQAILFAVFDDSQGTCPVDDAAAQTAGAAFYGTLYTGLTGEATLNSVGNLPGGGYLVCAYFREKPSYGASTASFSFTVNSPPVATDDSYTANAGVLLDVPAPGVLENDSDPDGDDLVASLVTGATEGVLVLQSDGSFTYQITNAAAGGDSFTYAACDVPYGECDQATVSIDFNTPPVCDNVVVLTAQGNYPTLWPTNKRETDVYLSGATDEEDGANLEYFFWNILQDEEIGDTDDALITPSCTDAWVRSERDGQGDGRVYEIEFIVRDSAGATCTGKVDIATLPHDQGGGTSAVKGPVLYSSGPLAACTRSDISP